MSASERGVSLLAALVFVAILSVAAVGIQSAIPSDNPRALTAQAAAPVSVPKSPEGAKTGSCEVSVTRSDGTVEKYSKVYIVRPGDTDYTLQETGYTRQRIKDGKTACDVYACDADDKKCIYLGVSIPSQIQNLLKGTDAQQFWSAAAGPDAAYLRGFPPEDIKNYYTNNPNSALPNATTLNDAFSESDTPSSPPASAISNGTEAAAGPQPSGSQTAADCRANPALCTPASLLPGAKPGGPITGEGKVPCTGASCRDTTGFDGKRGGGNENDGGRGGSGGGGLGSLAPLLAGFLKGLMGPPQAPAQTCPADPNAYAQQQQQYQQQLQQYNYQLQQYNYQQQYSGGGYQVVSTDPVVVVPTNSGYGGYSAPEPIRPTPCTPSTSQQCQSQPAQPPAQNCNAGTWRPIYNGACITNWQCVASSGPQAQISCQPQVADVGMTLAISYSCSAGIAIGSGFTASTSPSGSATTTIATPPAGTNTATYRLTCNNNGVTAGAECRVQVALPIIVLVANPKTVHQGDTSLIGWVTTGMQSCVVSSPDDSSFTSRNSSNTSIAGTATTSPITAATSFLLHCQTTGGGTRDATTTVSVQ